MFSPDLELSSSTQPDYKNFYAIIEKIGKRKLVPKGKLIIRKGSHAAAFYYIRKGAFKTVVKTPHKNYILAFTFDDDIECCPTALLNNLPNNLDVEAVIDSEVLVCDIDTLKKEAGGQEYFKIVCNILHHYAIFLETQLIASLSLTAEQRYHNLLLQQPDKIKQIPLSHIASYLGITLERLSRIRKKLKG